MKQLCSVPHRGRGRHWGASYLCYKDQDCLGSPVSKCSNLLAASRLAGLEEGEVGVDRSEEWALALWTPWDWSSSEKVVAGVQGVESGKGDRESTESGKGDREREGQWLTMF